MNRFKWSRRYLGLFHYLPDAEKTRELRSVVVEAGDAVLFTRGLVHTFTAPLGDLTLLSYHVPFFEFDDTRQFTIPRQSAACRHAWLPGRLVSTVEYADAASEAPVA